MLSIPFYGWLNQILVQNVCIHQIIARLSTNHSTDLHSRLIFKVKVELKIGVYISDYLEGFEKTFKLFGHSFRYFIM